MLTRFVSGRSGVSLVFSSRNGGGAGGFATGIAWAVAEEATHIWLMDDDAIPLEDCLENLLETFTNGRSQAFATPLVLDSQGVIGPRNYPHLSTSVPAQYRAVEDGLLKIDATTFVGPLLSAQVVKKTHLPLADFFIWHDDMEYTSRLAQFGDSFAVPAARIEHHAQNPGPTHFNGDRNFFNVRNYIWWLRSARRTDAFSTREIATSLLFGVRNQWRAAPKKLSYVAIVAKASFAGFFTSPAKQTVAVRVQESVREDLLFGEISRRGQVRNA